MAPEHRNVSTWASSLGLTPDQQARAKQVITALARKFFLQPGDFGIVSVGSRPVVTLIAKAGIDAGKWEDIFDPSHVDRFLIDIDGRTIDTRSGMTKPVYEAFIAAAAARGEYPPPDSRAMAGDTNEFMRATYLTGETDGFSHYAVNREGNGTASVYRARPFGVAKNRRFRPAVLLPSGAEQALVSALTTALAHKFSVAEDDIGTVTIRDPLGQEREVVLLKSGSGVYCGEWNDIFAASNRHTFMIEVAVQSYDTREGLTHAVYEAFIKDWQARGLDPMPDSLARANGDTAEWTSTFLTGETSDRLSRYASWSGTAVSVVPLNPALPGSQTRFRPAVWLDEAP